MLGIQKDSAQLPTLCHPGVRVLALATALIAFAVLAFQNSEISPGSLPSVLLPSIENGSIPSPFAMEKPADPGRNSSVPGSVSPPLEHRKVNASSESEIVRGSDNSSHIVEATKRKTTNQTTATAEEMEASSCEVGMIPAVSRKTRTDPLSIPEMNQILSDNRRSSCSMVPRWSSKTDLQILRARREIENAPIVEKDPELYAPAFRNISMFKSVRLQGGEKPIFHSPQLTGIYSSEGWFMKNMEGSTRFRVEDPTKAHLFYIPFSSKILREKLFFPGSHRKYIIQYLKDYVATIAGKYPFWNRTGGADHFFAACHDWAPAETQEVMGKTIRALCNANLARMYELGKDVTLPEANRPVLAFFAGKMHGHLRPLLLQQWRNRDNDIKVFGPLGRGARKQNATMSYAEYMRSSRYCICPRGYEVHSPRVVEAIFYQCVPAIISDNFVPPLFEVLNWEAFSVVVAEKDVPRLKEILLSIPEKKYLALQAGVRGVRRHFLWHNMPERYDAFHMTLHSVWFNRVFQFKPRLLQ
ncbi:unnamed protein product [Spirodela intermedia]|uniref:Exostosin GT47 domain-containing protein n=1 Tax=Spirodela intermedia TaxID=51605 RepID=A0A7I8JPC7_SPIIN|nr:unnamed protein product [Spirodela intermedia]CAA6671625.1 unnamed protein product [Spirodela intermedia]